MVNNVRHFFIPHELNNHRASLLHHKSLMVIIGLLFIQILFFPVVKTNYPQILGVSIDISSEELLSLTNQKRAEAGLPPLEFNNTLSNAAILKAKDMFAKNYWAHNAPDGTTPWEFIKDAKYQYVYAGENLAKGFTVSEDVVDAWMRSTTHRENVLSPNYKDVGFAVAKGDLNGEETVLVVEMFGNSQGQIAEKQISNVEVSGVKTFLSSINSRPLINSAFLSKNLAILLVGIFMLVLAIDFIIVEKRKIVRFVGHNASHILFLGTILLIVIAIGRGVII